MAKIPPQQLSDKTKRQLQRVVERDAQNKTQKLGSADIDEIGTIRHVRLVKCSANSICATYPAPGATKFPIQMGELKFDETECGDEEGEWTLYEPQETYDRVAYDFSGAYHEEDSYAQVFLCHGRWYFNGSAAEILAEAIASTNHCPSDDGGSGSGSEGQEVSVEDFRLQPSCTLVDPPPRVTNPRNHRWPAGSLLTMTKRRCPGDEEDEWRVIDVELRKTCVVIGLEDRPSCLVSASLFLGLEWCPTDEPTTACAVVNYSDCSGDLPACDTAWVFLVASCCGDGSGGG